MAEFPKAKFHANRRPKKKVKDANYNCKKQFNLIERNVLLHHAAKTIDNCRVRHCLRRVCVALVKNKMEHGSFSKLENKSKANTINCWASSLEVEHSLPRARIDRDLIQFVVRSCNKKFHNRSARQQEVGQRDKKGSTLSLIGVPSSMKSSA